MTTREGKRVIDSKESNVQVAKLSLAAGPRKKAPYVRLN